jgi:hypothetical protein
VLVDGLAGAQSPEVLGARVPHEDALRLVQHDDGEAQRGENRLEELVDAVELPGPVAQLVVDRPELLVGRLELLVHRLELVDRRLELRVRGLQIPAVRFELRPHRRDAADVLQHDQRARRDAAAHECRRIRACVSAVKYMSVLRHTSRSSREIGASSTRLLVPKIRVRRRSLRNA